MELDQSAFGDIRLMEGERIDSALNLTGKNSGDPASGPQVMLLTDRRIIRLDGNGERRKVSFASIQDVDTVEISAKQGGKGAFIWATMAFIAAGLLYPVIPHALGRAVAVGITALMGVYLVVDRLMDPGRPLVIFKAGSSQLWCDLNGDQASADVHVFINRLFELKAEDGSDNSSRANHFAPR